MPPTPIQEEDIPDLPQAYRTTTNGDPFLVYDSSVGDEERIFIFVSQDALQFLADSKDWYADGTFRSVRKFSSNCVLYMVSVTEECFFASSHFCQIKTKTLTTDYLNSYFNS